MTRLCAFSQQALYLAFCFDTNNMAKRRFLKLNLAQALMENGSRSWWLLMIVLYMNLHIVMVSFQSEHEDTIVCLC